jgi:protein O-GlcNAc transferase
MASSKSTVQPRAAQAQQRLQAGDFAGARRIGDAILTTPADAAEHAAAHLVVAACGKKEGKVEIAASHVQAALALTPNDPIAYYLDAELKEAMRDLSGAIASLSRALQLNPKFVQAYHYAGILKGESGDLEGAATAFAEAIRLEPGHARSWNNLGNVQRSLGRMDEAKASFAHALLLRPDYDLAAANLASVQRDIGEVEAAETTLRDALKRHASTEPYRPLLVLLAGLLRERGLLDEATQLYTRAIAVAPEKSAGEWFNLGLVLGERGEPDAARDAFRRSYAVDRTDLRGLIGEHLTLPMISPDANAVEATREEFRAGIATLTRNVDAAVHGLSEAQVIDGMRWTNFFLAYQGCDDRELQSEYAAFVARAIDVGAPGLRAPLDAGRRHGGRVRVGFASAFFHVGTCGRYFKSWITDLDRDRFEVFVYHLWPGIDDIAGEIERRADRFQTFGGSKARPSLVARAIRDDALDVLVYPELGMDVGSFALAALRLAPRQYCGWGHPVTTGHATIDAFLSCATMEPACAAAHYSERLIQLPGIGTRYERPLLPTGSTSRAALGLPDAGVLLLCPQSLFKIHPENDALFADILIENPDAILVFFAGRHPVITDQFMRRFKRTLDACGISIRDRTRVIPQVGHDDFLRINLACDAMVDTLRWSGGNTSLDALACGLPVVTLPGEFMRGRQSAGMLSMMQVPELIAADRSDFIAITSRLTRDPVWRQTLAARIRAAQANLFDRDDASVQLARLLQGELLPET